MTAPVIARLRDGSPVGAWILKANPAVWDIGGFLASGAEVDHWRLAPSYRCDLVAPGHPAVLWVTRGDTALVSGVWALGSVLAAPVEDVGDEEDDLWRDHGARRQVRPYVEVRLVPLADPVTAVELRSHPVLRGAEVFRVPRMGSPMALSPTELDALRDLLPDGR